MPYHLICRCLPATATVCPVREVERDSRRATAPGWQAKCCRWKAAAGGRRDGAALRLPTGRLHPQPHGNPGRRTAPASLPQRQVSRFFATFAGIMKGFRRWVSPAAVACVAVAMLAVAMAAEAAGQAKIMTKKFRLSDFTDRVTKVVLSGNEMMDSALKMEVSERWTVSPFEFCTAGEFAALKQSDRYYFLLVTMQDPAMRFLTAYFATREVTGRHPATATKR